MTAIHRILIIDDNRAIHDDFRKILCPEPEAEVDETEAALFAEKISASSGVAFELQSAFQGEEGVALLERALADGRPPAVAFVDMRMPPGMDGIETAERLWQLSPELQVVICSAYSDYSWEEMITRISRRSPILLSTQLLHRDWPASTREELVCAIEKSAGRAASVVRQVLTFARGIHGERFPIRPKQLVREVEKIIRETFPKTIAIDAQFSEDLGMIEGDAMQLHQVLMNLCVNAREAMSDGGALGIAVENFEADANYARMIPGAGAGPYVRLRVTDTGTGIPADALNKIFDPFFTTKPSGNGAGLGLSTVAGIVKSHDGFINVRSEMGQGALLEIFLPAVRETASESSAGEGKHGEL